MEKLYEKHAKIYSPTEDELLELLLELLKGFEQAYIIVDALDECDEYHQLFELITAIHQGQVESHLHLLVSSRREQEIIVMMEECHMAEVQLSAEFVETDIMSYVQSAVKEYRLKRWGHKVQDLIKEKLISGANGMYVECLQSIRDT